MRILKTLQLFLAPAKVATDRARELEEMDQILCKASGLDEVLKQILRDINGGKDSKVGRDGVTSEQVLKLGLLRRRHGLRYRELAAVTGDSISMRGFLNLEPGKSLSKSAIQGNLKKVKDTTWELASCCLLKYAAAKGIEDGKAVRGDTTVVETNIHHPTDAGLLNDVVRVLCRNMSRAREIAGELVLFTNHRRRAKTKLYKINNVRGEDRRHPHYLELIRVTRDTVEDAQRVLAALELYTSGDFFEMLRMEGIKYELKTYIPLGKRVVHQAHRRIVKNEQLPVSEKIVSIFETHTDIIVKGFRDVIFGHKIMLTTGRSGSFLTCVFTQNA